MEEEKIKIDIAVPDSDILRIVYDLSPEVREMFRLYKETNQEYYDHPLVKSGGGYCMCDINSKFAKSIIKYQKTGKIPKKLEDEILQDIKDRMNTIEKLFQKELKKKPKRGYIYILKSKHLYKIGRAEYPESRIRTYITENPFGIEVIFQKEVDNYIMVESKLLRKFRNKQFRGEWFQLNDKDIKWIKENI